MESATLFRPFFSSLSAPSNLLFISRITQPAKNNPFGCSVPPRTPLLHPRRNSRSQIPFLFSTHSLPEHEQINNNAPESDPSPSPSLLSLLEDWTPPLPLLRAIAALLLAGQVAYRTLTFRIHGLNTLQQCQRVGPGSLGVCLLTSTFIGMAFTFQFVREFTRLGLQRSVGGVLALALARELSPVVTSVVVAGRVGSAFAAEIGAMQVSEQIDALRILGTHPVDYLVTPRVIACAITLPFLTIFCFTMGLASSAFLADVVFGIDINIILESARRALRPWDLTSAMIKSHVFGVIIAVISCTWGITTLGGAKGVGESTTSAVVISLVSIFIADFVLSYFFFQGAGDSLKRALG